MTNQTQIDKARSIATRIEQMGLTGKCMVDDWNDYGSFTIFFDLPNVKIYGRNDTYSMPYRDGTAWRSFPMRRLTDEIRGAIKAIGGRFEYMEVPQRMYWDKILMGYDSPFIKLSVFIP